MSHKRSYADNDTVLFVTGGYDHQIKFWHAHTGACYHTIQHQDSQINDLEISPDKRFLAVAGYQHIRLFDALTNNPNPIVNYDGVSKNISVVGFQMDGKWMFSGGEDNLARIWDIRSKSNSSQRMYQTNSPVNTIALHPNQIEMFIGDQNGVLHIWDLRNDQHKEIIPEAGASIQCLSIKPDGTSLTAVTNKGSCHIWRIVHTDSSQNILLESHFTMQAHKKYILKCQFSPDATLIATTSADGLARIWRTSDRTKILELKDQNQRWVWDCAFTEDSQFLITASSDNVARLWNVTTGEMVREFVGHSKAITSLAFRDIPIE